MEGLEGFLGGPAAVDVAGETDDSADLEAIAAPAPTHESSINLRLVHIRKAFLRYATFAPDAVKCKAFSPLRVVFHRQIWRFARKIDLFFR
jgi:hypothetical protein